MPRRKATCRMWRIWSSKFFLTPGHILEKRKNPRAPELLSMQLCEPYVKPAWQMQPALPDAAFVQSAPGERGPGQPCAAHLTAAVICGAGKHTESLKINSVTFEDSCLFTFSLFVKTFHTHIRYYVRQWVWWLSLLAFPGKRRYIFFRPGNLEVSHNQKCFHLLVKVRNTLSVPLPETSSQLSHSVMSDFVTPWTAARQASLYQLPQLA